MTQSLIPGYGLYTDPEDGSVYLVPGYGLIASAAAGGTTHEAAIPIAVTNSISQVNLITASGILSLGITSDISQSSLIDYITSNSLELNNSISQSSDVIYIGDISLGIVQDNSQTGSTIASVEATISLPLFVSLSTGTTYSTSSSTILGVIESIDQTSNIETDQSLSLGTQSTITNISGVDYEVDFLQNIIESIVQTAVKETDSDASISVSITLADEYTNTATLNDSVLIALNKAITSTVGNTIEGLFTDGTVSTVSSVGEITIEGITSLGLSLDITETVTAVMESAIGIDIDLAEFQSATGNYLTDFISNLSLSDASALSQELFEAVGLDTTISVSTNGYTTDFVVKTPNKRIIITLDSDRMVVSLGTDRTLTSI